MNRCCSKNRWVRTAAAAVLTVLLLVPIFPAVQRYLQPLDDQIFDFSILAEDGQEWGGMNGWTVYRMEDGKAAALEADGYGGFYGLAYPGETFYYSRILTQSLPDPVLEIGVANRNVAVFLDDDLLYTDCPELDNRIGYLTLPMAEYDRAEPVRVSLPPGYTGRTLTVAQSSPPAGGWDKQGAGDTVWPCSVRLFCGYAYESGMVADTARTVYPAAACGVLGALVLLLLLWKSWKERFDAALLILALFLLLSMMYMLFSAPFGSRYFSILDSRQPQYIDLPALLQMAALAALLMFLSVKARRCRYLFWALTVLQAVNIAGHFFLQWKKHLFVVPAAVEWFGWLLPGVALVLGLWEWKKRSPFFRQFGWAAFTVIGVSFGAACAAAAFWPDARVKIVQCAGNVLQGRLQPLSILLEVWLVCAVLWAAVAEFVIGQVKQNTETFALRMRDQAARASYADIRRQMRESAMLRHDLNRHWSVLDQFLADGQTSRARQYIRDMSRQTAGIRPLLASGNYMVDTIFNSRLPAIQEEGVRVDIRKAEVPAQLPVQDADLCSLLLNALDNASAAVRSPDVEHPAIRLDLHTKGKMFCVRLANTYCEDQQKEPMPGHGLGLKIMEQIVQKYRGMMQVERTGGWFEVILLLPAEGQEVT